MKLFALLITLFFSSLVVAAKPAPQAAKETLRSPKVAFEQLGAERNGLIEIVNRVTCDARDPALCIEMCALLSCEWTEPYCRDCLGTGSSVMRSIFIELLPAYTAFRMITNQEEIRSLMVGIFTGMMLVVPPASTYDYFNENSAAGIRPHLRELCGSDTGFIGVTLDAEARPASAAAAFCVTPQGLRATLLKINRKENENTKLNNLTGETHVQIVP